MDHRCEAGKVIGGVEMFQDLRQIEQLQKELESRYTFADIIGRSEAMRNLFEIVLQIVKATAQC